MHINHTQHGFTLTEIIVTMAILSILATLTLVTFSTQTKKTALDNSYATVLTAFERTRSKAVNGVGGETTAHEVSVRADGTGVEIGTTHFAFSPGVTISDGGTTVTFNRISGATTPHTFTLTDHSGQTKDVTITSTGYAY